MANTVVEIATLIANKILTGGRRTTAQWVRDVLTPINTSFLNLKDGGNVVESLSGYASVLTPTDPKHFATKKYVDDAAGGVFTVSITTTGATIYNIAHNLNSLYVITSICRGQGDFQELLIPPKRTDANTVQYDLGGYPVSGTIYLITIRK
jgi:hypothetical protein